MNMVSYAFARTRLQAYCSFARLFVVSMRLGRGEWCGWLGGVGSMGGEVGVGCLFLTSLEIAIRYSSTFLARKCFRFNQNYHINLLKPSSSLCASFSHHCHSFAAGFMEGRIFVFLSHSAWKYQHNHTYATKIGTYNAKCSLPFSVEAPT